MKKQIIKRVVGITGFVLVCLAICIIVDQTSIGKVRGSRTYGEYQKKRDAWQQECVDVSALEGENKEAQLEQRELTKTAFLTFDDGPSENTEKVLDILDEYDVKATFFLVGQEINEETEPIIKRMIESGHVVGIHTWNHNRKKIYRSEESCMEDIVQTSERIADVTGETPKYYRFPYGSANCYISGFCCDVIADLNQLNIQYVDWNVTGEDAVGHPTSSSIMKNIRKFDKYMEPVILLHDGKTNGLTVKCLPKIIEKIKAAGYEFGTIEDRSKPYQWTHKWQK